MLEGDTQAKHIILLSDGQEGASLITEPAGTGPGGGYIHQHHCPGRAGRYPAHALPGRRGQRPFL